MSRFDSNQSDKNRLDVQDLCLTGWDRSWRNAFSLVEMLAVIAVIGLIAATTAPTLFSTMKANRISAAGEDIVNRISLAQQMAVSRNHEIELRFYRFADPENPTSLDHYRATLIAQPAPDPDAPGTVETIVLSDMNYLRNGIVVANEALLSPIFAEAGRADTTDADKRITGAAAKYKTIRFFPDGTSDLPLVTNMSYLTVVEERDLAGATGGVPKNFFAVQIDHYTSRSTTYRP